MTADKFVNLIEELTDLKIQHFAESTMKTTPEIAKILAEKRQTDRRRLDQIKAELVRSLES